MTKKNTESERRTLFTFDELTITPIHTPPHPMRLKGSHFFFTRVACKNGKEKKNKIVNSPPEIQFDSIQLKSTTNEGKKPVTWHIPRTPTHGRHIGWDMVEVGGRGGGWERRRVCRAKMGGLNSGVGSACTFEQILLPNKMTRLQTFFFSGYLFYNLKFLVQEDSLVGVDLAF